MLRFLKLSFVVFFVCGCSSPQATIGLKKDLLPVIGQNLRDGTEQYKRMSKRLAPNYFPKSFDSGTNKVHDALSSDWCSGFYPGTLLYLYEQTKDPYLLKEAKRILKVLEKEKHNKTTHDLGFMMYCSFGNAVRITGDSNYRSILLTSANSLASRFNPKVGCIKSWDNVKSHDKKTTFSFPVIIDNMINLELLFYASGITGDLRYRNMAISHARATMRNHLRPDNSSYHVVDYDPQSGAVKLKETHQGFAHNSTWSRGQAWGVYGFTMVYRETKEKAFLQTAEQMADYFIAHLPKDNIPFWDFNVDQPGFTPEWNYDRSKFPFVPKDASAAAITASALLELSTYTNKEKQQKYLKTATNILAKLSTPAYKATIGSNGNFILMHSTGNAPAYSEIDAPLSYSDYYFVEAMKRYKELSAK